MTDRIPGPDLPPEDAGWLKGASSLAAKEEANWGDLAKVRVDNDRSWLKVYGWIVIIVTITFTMIFLAGIVAWSLHYVLPDQHLWLSTEQLSKIQSILFSGGMGAVVSTVVKRQMGRLERPQPD